MIRGWICETCGKGSRTQPWNCPTCRKEVCECCFDSYAHCSQCAMKFTESQLIHAANAQGFDFDEGAVTTGAGTADESVNKQE